MPKIRPLATVLANWQTADKTPSKTNFQIGKLRMSKKLRILQTAQLDWRDETPLAIEFDDFYYSTEDAIAESDYVFLQHNQIEQRLKAFNDGLLGASFPLESEQIYFRQKSVFRVAETGFGTGLNFLLTMRAWFNVQAIDEQALPAGNGLSPATQLHFISFEKHPMSQVDLQRSLQAYPELSAYSDILIDHYPDLLPGWHEVLLFSGRVRLSLWLGDALQGLAECAPNAKVDAWYLDGFAPIKNPQLWNPKLYQAMVKLSHQKTTFATFTAAGEVRRGLQAVGFDVHKDSGYGKKREMCFGQIKHLRSSASKTPWFVANCPKNSQAGRVKSAVVVGAGLAGATTAYALAQAGFKVKVLESATETATQASGNLAGTLHPLVTVDWNLRSQFYQLGYNATQRWLLPWLASKKAQGDLSGMLQLAAMPIMHKRLLEALKRVPLPENYANWLEPDEASQVLGVKTHLPGMFYPNSGWIYPKSVIEHCLKHPNIELVLSCEVHDFEKVNGLWKLETSQGDFETECLVFATGSLASKLHEKLKLSIRPVKGQVTHLSSNAVKSQLNVPITHKGYSSPTAADVWVTGATFEAPSLTTDLSEEAHRENIANVQQVVAGWLSEDCTEAEHVGGRIAFRPTTPDHLPVIGQVPDWNWVEENYLQQSHTHAVYRYPEMRYQQGLFVNNGHGPRGLMSVFLAAEWLLAEIDGRESIAPESLRNACHPARFVIRQWRSGKAS